jgi:hypothetical protein
MRKARAAGALLVALAALAVPRSTPAQIANASAAALGMAENFTAVARGYHAVAWNPAALATRGNTRSSFSLFGGRVMSGIGPVSLADLARYDDAVVPDDVKRAWLGRITSAGGQRGHGGGDLNWIAMQFGRFAFHASTSAVVRARISPGAAELVMFGNVADDGTPSVLDPSGSLLRGAAFSAVGTSLAHAVDVGHLARISIGATGKYIYGHTLVWGDESQGEITADPLALRLAFPVVHVRTREDQNRAGQGIGVDVGAALEVGAVTIAASLQNAVNTFSWDEALLVYRPNLAIFDEQQRSAQTTERPFAEAPDAVRRAIREQTFDPIVLAGIAARPSAALVIAADFRASTGDGIPTSPTRHLGVGAELLAAPWLPLRLGGAVVSLGDDANGYQIGAGAGLRLGPFSLSAGYARRDTELGVDNILMFGGVSSLR